MLRGPLARRAICGGKHAAGAAVGYQARLLLLLQLLAQLLAVHQSGSRRMAQGQEASLIAFKIEAFTHGAAVPNLVLARCAMSMQYTLLSTN